MREIRFHPGQMALYRGRGYGPVVVEVTEVLMVDGRILYRVHPRRNPGEIWLVGGAELDDYEPSRRSPWSGRKARRGQRWPE